MATDVYQGAAKIGRVSTSGEVYLGESKVGWANSNGNVYLDGVPYGWVTIRGNVLDRRLIPVGHVDPAGGVYRGNDRVGRVEDASSRYYTAGAALLLLLGQFDNEPKEPSGEPGPAAR